MKPVAFQVKAINLKRQVRAGETGRRKAGAGEGNRTLVYSLGSCRSTIELRPL